MMSAAVTLSTMDWIFVLEALVVLGAIVMGTRVSGIGVGLWGGLGTAVLVLVFGEAPGDPPASAVAIILAVVTAASTMQARLTATTRGRNSALAFLTAVLLIVILGPCRCSGSAWSRR
jgi:anaerobic C4-dicarboxylate transporter